MSAGTLFVRDTFRATPVIAIAKYLGIEINVEQKEGNAQFEKLFPAKKIPAFVTADGFTLHEVIAIIVYFSSLTKNELLGSTKEDYASILQWISFANQDVWQALRGAIFPTTGRAPYNKKGVDAALAEADNYLAIFENHLTKHTYLVGERVTAADVFVTGVLARGFGTFWGTKWQEEHPAVTRYFKTVSQQEILSFKFKDFEFREEPIKYTPPKKEAPAKKETPKAAPKAAAPAEEEEEYKEKKVAHPLSLLPKSKMVLDEWKRCYSNEETRETALPWFWEHYDAEEWSLWKVAYKYNDELTLTFMSNNLVGGFFNRLSASIKYMFGGMVVAGENNDNGIVGAFLVRGQDYKPAFDVAPDWESYEFTKLDATKPEDRALVEDLWAWDKPVEVDGKLREVADGKVLK